MAGNINDLNAKAGIDYSEFKAGVAELNRNIRVIDSSFKAAAAGMDDWRKSSEGLQTRIKALSDITTLQKSKIAALQDEYEKIATTYGENSKAAQDMQIKINRASEELNKNEKELRDCTSALDKMAAAEGDAGTKAASMGNNIGAASDKTKTFGSSISEFANSSIGQFASVAGAVGLAKQAFQALSDMIENATNWADDILTLSTQTGIAVNTLQKMEYAARFVDVEVDTMTKGLSKTVKSISEANSAGKDYIEITNGVTVSTKDQNGQLRDSEQVFYNIIDALGNVANETERETAAQQIFGKSYQDVMPLIKAGSSAIQNYGSEAQNSGIIIDNITVKALGHLDDKLEDITAASEARSKKFAASMARQTEAVAEAWEFLKNSFISRGNIANNSALMTRITGQTEEQATIMIKQNEAIQNVAYITEKSLEDVKTEADSFSQYLIGQGVPSAEAYSQALNYMADNVDIVGYAHEKMSEAQQVWNDKVKTAAEEYVALSDQYTAQVQAVSERYLSQMGGMFDAFPQKVKTSMDKLLEIERTQVDGAKEFSDNIQILISRGVDEGVISNLRKMGYSAAGEIETLAHSSDAKLKEWVDLFHEKGRLATEAAEDELKPLANQVAAAMTEVGNVVRAQNDEMEKLGRELGKGIGDGIDSSTWYVKQQVKNVVAAAIAAARNTGGGASSGSSSGGSYPAYGVGGVVNTPHLAIVGDEPEIIIPLNNKPRSMELLAYANQQMAARGLAEATQRLNSGISSAAFGSTAARSGAPREVIVNIQFPNEVNISSDYDIEHIAEKLGAYTKDALNAIGG